MENLVLTNGQARNFLLLKQGLIGEYRFQGREGVCGYIGQAGCIQSDPIDVCGKNAELVLQSRVHGFEKKMLDGLLYEDRRLIDYFDKNMSIFLTGDWKYFSRIRERHIVCGRSRDSVDAVADAIISIIRERKFACSGDIGIKGTVDWYWSPTALSRAALETLYFRGELIIHHKKGNVKYYALAGDFLDGAVLEAADPNATDEDFYKWRVLRRIGSVGLLWNRPSDAWLGIGDFKSECRNRVFSSLMSEGKISECAVEGIPEKLYFLSEDRPVVELAQKRAPFQARLEFIAPLDNLLWDRRLIKAIFGFDYKWEIYTPVSRRKYGYYVLPVLYGNRFAGRAEFAVDKKSKKLQLLNYWPEKDADPDVVSNDCFRHSLSRLAAFNKCDL